MKTTFLFAGQGAQHVGMGKDFYDKYDSYKEAVNSIKSITQIKRIMDNGPDEMLSMTENTQPCMALFTVGVLSVLKEKKIFPDAVCGLSIGEYGALYAAGMITANEYIDIVSYRGKVMAEASQESDCAMSAIIGIDSDTVLKAVNESKEAGYVTIANYNCPGQYVICGDIDAVEKCEKICKDYKAKQTVRLNVSGPFHTKYMKIAGNKLRIELDKINFGTPKIPVLLNTTGNYYDNQSIQAILEEQVQSSVHFEEELVKLFEDGFDTFIEIGPGKNISGFVKRTAKKLKTDCTCFSIDSVEDIDKILDYFYCNDELLIKNRG